MTASSPPRSLEDLLQAAKTVQKKAYSPYSGYAVAAALRTQSGKIYVGCNVENSSFGATNCAERVAIQNAITEEGPIEIAEILVLTDSQGDPWPPCGLCRQVIAEFAPDPKAVTVHLATPHGVVETLKFDHLFPRSFNPRYLKRNS